MANIIKLNTGKALGAFPGFVETFNWLVDFCMNLKGNGEEYNDSGSDEDRNGIVVDRSVPDHPVIRGGGGGGGEPQELEKEEGKFSLVSGNDSNLKFTTTTSIETGEDGSEIEVKTCTIDVYYV